MLFNIFSNDLDDEMYRMLIKLIDVTKPGGLLWKIENFKKILIGLINGPNTNQITFNRNFYT